jgi:predicted DCC family thiol-disulfide oxidoreductase YuxK
VFRFASLQSAAAQAALAAASAPTSLPDSVVVIDDGDVLTLSRAVLRIARRLGFPWSLACVAWVIPRPILDWGYRVIARNRHRWFGKADTCPLPRPDERELFLDDAESYESVSAPPRP